MGLYIIVGAGDPGHRAGGGLLGLLVSKVHAHVAEQLKATKRGITRQQHAYGSLYGMLENAMEGS